MATPIETNTEELQEILQTVYNLPMAGGGSSEPDLVITLDNSSNSTNIDNHPEKFTFNSEDAISVYNKLLTGQTVNCVLNATYWPSSGGCFNASSPHVTALAKSDDNNSARAGYLGILFNLSALYNGYNSICTVHLDFNITHSNTAVITKAIACMTVPYTSAFL